MTHYIIGLIAGSIITVFPLVYLMSFDRSLALVLQAQPDFDPAMFAPACPPELTKGVTAIGAVVVLLSIAMMAITGLRQSRRAQKEPQSAESSDSASAGAEPTSDDESPAAG